MNKSAAVSSFVKSLRFADTLIDSSGNLSELQQTELNGETEHEVSPDIPDVNERLAYLKPSRQLLEFYRKKFAEQDCEHESLVDRIQTYKTIYDSQHDTEWGMRQREEEMVELQKAISEMQMSLFQEREQVLRLYAENDRYKIHDLSSRRAIKKLLEESGHKITEDEPTDLSLCTAGRGRQAKLSKVPKSTGYKLVVDSQPPGEDDRVARQALHKQIEAQQNKLESQTRDYKEAIERKLEERQRLADEYNYVRERDMDKVKTATEKLYKTQDLLYLSTKDVLNLRSEARLQERQWMIQKDKLLRELDSVKEQLNIDQPEQKKKVVLNVSNNAGDSTHRHKQELKKLREEVGNAHHLQEMYREQVVTLEDDVARLREQDDLKNDDFNDKVTKMGKRHSIMKERFEDLEKRRNLEVEGFKNDIKALRKRLKEMQSQIFKVTLGRADSILDDTRPDDLDLAVLRNMQTTAKRSTKLNDGLKNMKLRIHNMQQANNRR